MSDSDRDVVERQLGRRPRAFRRVVVRCPFGLPAVTEQAPFDENGTPFPTQFWLTCPHLVARVARAEAAGGVERWTGAAAADPALARSLAAAHAEQRVLRSELPTGVGGAARTGSLKCLHAHAAFALARPGYELGDLILADAGPLSACDELLLGVTRLSSADVDVELTRQQWLEGSRRIEDARGDSGRYARLHRDVELVLAELRRRVGQIFTLEELAAAYAGADDWTRALLDDAAPEDGPPAEAALAADAAFHVYARGASDYAP